MDAPLCNDGAVLFLKKALGYLTEKMCARGGVKMSVSAKLLDDYSHVGPPTDC
jgi:hypothetical protein